jgi:DNA-binding MarR family transcriptional regulator
MKRNSIPLPPAHPAPELDELLHSKPGYLIRRLQQMAVSIFLEETGDFEITPVQYATLAAVSVFPGIDQLRVANAIGFDRTTISGVVDRLEAKNLIARKVSGLDRRSKMLFATADGVALVKQIQEATERVQARILGPLTVAEQKTFLGYLDRLVLFHNHASRVPIDHALIPAASSKKPKRSKGHEQ